MASDLPVVSAGAVPLERSAPRRGRVLFRHAFVPGLLVLLIGSVVYRSEVEQALATSHLGVDLVTFAVLGSIVALWLAEQLFPANPAWNYRLLDFDERGWSRLGRDLLYFFVIAQLSAWLVRLTSLGLNRAVAALAWSAPHALWPAGAPALIRIALAFLLVELGSYWFHRAAHSVEVLWRFHSAHHVITELTALKAIRTHPVDNVLFHLARSVPLLLLGASAEDLVAVIYLGSILSLLAHANIDVSDRGLGWVVNFPRYHSVHHSAVIAESKSNFGCHTILWDRIFGTFRPAPEGTFEVGVAPVGPRTLAQELLWPFYRSVDPG